MTHSIFLRKPNTPYPLFRGEHGERFGYLLIWGYCLQKSCSRVIRHWFGADKFFCLFLVESVKISGVLLQHLLPTSCLFTPLPSSAPANNRCTHWKYTGFAFVTFKPEIFKGV